MTLRLTAPMATGAGGTEGRAGWAAGAAAFFSDFCGGRDGAEGRRAGRDGAVLRAGVAARRSLPTSTSPMSMRPRKLAPSTMMTRGAAMSPTMRPSLVISTDSVAAPFEMGLSGENTDIRDLMDLKPEDVIETQRAARHDLDATNKASAILRKGNDRAYDKALRALSPDSRDWWDGYVEEEEYTANAEGLASFITKHLSPLCHQQEKESRHHDAIVNQTIGEGLQAYKLEKLSRYETHLDRKFERTLAMLIKLKDLRRSRAA